MNSIKTKAVADAALVAFSAILEAMPVSQRVSAANYARAFIDAGLVDGEETRRFVEGLFLLVDNPS